MKLTEAQIKQVIESSIEARRPAKVHILTEQQLRKAVRHHLKTGDPINEGLLDLLKGALGGLFDAFSGAFTGALDSATGALGDAASKIQGELSAAMDGADIPPMEDLAPSKNPNDKALMSVYVGSFDWIIEDAASSLERIKEVDNPYPPTDGSDAEEWMGLFAPRWEDAATATAKLAAASKEISKHIPEARTLQKELEAAGEDPVAVLEAAKNGTEFWTGTIIPQLKSVNDEAALEKASDIMKSHVQEAIHKLEDMDEHFNSMAATIDEVLPKWIEQRDAVEEEVPEEEQEEAAEEAEENAEDAGDDAGGGGVPEEVAGEEDALGGEIVAGGDDEGGDDGGDDEGPEEKEEKLEMEGLVRVNSRQILLTEKQLKRLVRRLIIN